MEAGSPCVVELEELEYLERLIGDNNLLPVGFLEEGAAVQRAVAKVQLPGASGTGFLVSNNILMTNNHVLRSKADARSAKIHFNFQNDIDGNTLSQDVYSTDPDSLFYTNPALDFTIVRVKSKSIFNYPKFPPLLPIPKFDGLPPIDPRANIEQEFDPFGFRPIRWFKSPGSAWGFLPLGRRSFASGMHLNIIQHPRGRRKEISIQENTITQTMANTVQYISDTEPGSSGSPVFNNAWELIAIHHSAGERRNNVWISNEGMRIDRIVDDLVREYSSTSTGQNTLIQLGIS